MFKMTSLMAKQKITGQINFSKDQWLPMKPKCEQPCAYTNSADYIVIIGDFPDAIFIAHVIHEHIAVVESKPRSPSIFLEFCHFTFQRKATLQCERNVT